MTAMRTLSHTVLAAVTAASLLVASAPSFAQSACDPAINHMRAGSEFYSAGSFEAAYASFSCFIELYPADAYPQQNAEAFNMRGNALRELGDLPGAITEYSQALVIEPDYAIAFNNRGWASFLSGDFDSALADYDSAIALDPTLAYAYNNRGLIFQFQGVLRAAADDFERAIALGAEPTPWAQYNLGLVRLVEGRQGNSLLPAETIEVEVEADSAALLMGIDAHEAGQWRETIAYMTDVIAADPDEPRAYYLRGRAYMSLDDPQAAFADFNQLVVLAPALEFAYWERALAYAELGDFERAEADARRAMRMNSSHVNNFIVRGTIAALRGDAARAGREFLGVMLCNERSRTQHEGVAIGQTVTLAMTEGLVYEVPLTLDAGQTISLSAASTQADPVISLLAPDGTPVAGDDDSGFMLNALIEDFTADTDGIYTLMVSHAGGGSEGIIAVTVLPGA
jgi:tetratricopeptide (TPR) repeat protein